MIRPIAILTTSACLFMGLASRMDGRITRIQITRVESPTFAGTTFGDVGRYEKLVGRVFGEVDPADARDAGITDLAFAPTNSAGRVEYSTDIYILKPIDLSKGNHRVFFEINNRGSNLSFAVFNDAGSGGNDPTSAADAGTGFLMRQGYTIVWTGWDVTVPAGGGRFTMTVPVAKNADGTAITGPSLEELVADTNSTLTGPLTYAAASGDKSQGSLTVRNRFADSPVSIPESGWEYANATLTAIRLLPAGTPFQQGALYEFSYIAKDPLISGLSLAGIRDVGEFLRGAASDDQGTANPVAGDPQFVYSFCLSQGCRTMHDFVLLGFNQSSNGKRVFDGIFNWLGGAGSMFVNYRFAQPGRTHRQHIGRWYPEFEFPFANQILFDPNTGRTDGRLRRCLDSNTCPRIFEVNSSNDYWAKGTSVLHLDTAGKDLADPPNVRYYLMSSLPHVSGTGLAICQVERNPLAPRAVLRALLVAMNEWVSTGKEPPASRVPRVADGTLVPALPQATAGFPNIPGVVYNGRTHTGDLFNFGPRFSQGILETLPPVLVGSPYPVLVPKTDADGNEIAGIRIPEVDVPLATYTGWALRAFPAGAGEGCDAFGQKIAFADTKAQRLASGDPRLSIEERYPNHGSYVSTVSAVANKLFDQRLLLEADRKAYVENAANSSIGIRTMAVAGPKDALAVTRDFQLTAEGSTSVDGKPLTYSWTIAPGSPGAAILGGTSATPTVQFGTSRVDYTFQLTVTDSLGKSATDFVTIRFAGL